MKTKKSSKSASKPTIDKKPTPPVPSIDPLVNRLEATVADGRAAFLDAVGTKLVLQIAGYYDLATGGKSGQVIARIIEHVASWEQAAAAAADAANEAAVDLVGGEATSTEGGELADAGADEARDSAPFEEPAPTAAPPRNGANVGEQGANNAPTAEPPAVDGAPPPEATKKRSTNAATDGAPAAPKERDPRMPPVGTIVEKRDRAGKVRSTCQIVDGDKVLYNGTTYNSLSAAALASSRDCGLATKSVDGWSWWGLKQRPASPGSKKNPIESLDRAFQKYRECADAVAKSASGEDVAKVHEALRAQSAALAEMATAMVAA